MGCFVHWGSGTMTDRAGVFAGDNPFEIIERWLGEATETELRDPNAMSLATVDKDGLPNARIVLLKGLEADSVVFYTNYESQKAQELEGAGAAALLFHWKTLGRQIRLRGKVTREDGEKADAYYRSRPLQSRIGAWASAQSRVIESRGELEQKVQEFTDLYGDNPPRPPHWGGYRLNPTEIEFWCEGDFRLHDRFKWTCAENNAGWSVSRLSP